MVARQTEIPAPGIFSPREVTWSGPAAGRSSTGVAQQTGEVDLAGRGHRQ